MSKWLNNSININNKLNGNISFKIVINEVGTRL